ncbi:chymotrypsin inhibitor-like isoform X2 [Halictus rubicundus]|uniref:chymotrypsin inhibitor-like isoform X2 n=1 Tax=Halictus rubicundus TaxID=77578 RepID=UPI004035B813
MSRLTFVLFTVMLTLYTTVSADDDCPPNMIWSGCATPCPPTCKNPHPTICPDYCKAGCQCESGLLKNDLGECVPASKC